MISAGCKEPVLDLLTPSKPLALEPGKVLAAHSILLPSEGGLELLELGRLERNSCPSYLPPTDPVQAESVSIPIPWPLKK